MTAQDGNQLTLKLGDGGDPESFTTIGGLRDTRFNFASRAVDITNKGSAGWRDLLNGAGTRSLSISGSGVFTDTTIEDTLRQIAFTSALRTYQIAFGNGDTLEGTFKITAYGRDGGFDEQENYDITLESSGLMNYMTT